MGTDSGKKNAAHIEQECWLESLNWIDCLHKEQLKCERRIEYSSLQLRIDDISFKKKEYRHSKMRNIHASHSGWVFISNWARQKEMDSIAEYIYKSDLVI